MQRQPISLKRSVFNRLFVITFLVVLLFYGIGLYLNYMGMNNVRDDFQRAMDAEAGYIAGEIQREMDNLAIFQQELASDHTLLRYAIAFPVLSDYQRVECVENISNQLLRIKRFSSIVDTAKVHLYRPGRTIVADKEIYGALSASDAERFSQYKGMLPIHTMELGDQFFLLYTKREDGEPVFVVEIGLPAQKLMERLRQMSDTHMLLLREDGTSFAGTQGAAELDSHAEYNGREYVYDDQKYLMAETKIPALNMTLRCYDSVDGQMPPMLRYNQWIWMLTLLAAILLAAYLLYYRLLILRPLNMIFDSVRRAEETGHFEIDRKNAQTDDIYAQFTSMVEKLDNLAGRVYEEQFRAQRAELRQLQMQINPHFFYNTLFMVYRMAQADGNEEIANVCLNLSNYYRYITKTPGHDVLLKEEVAHVRQYLEIQTIRFSNRLSVDLQEMPAALEHEEIPPLMLQPIVENAFVHGMKDKTSGGHVEVRYRYTDAWYSVSVWDNSGQMDAEAVAELGRKLRCGEMDEGSALQNLSRRMELRYGKEYELRLESIQNGLCVTVTFPRKEKAEHVVTADR